MTAREPARPAPADPPGLVDVPVPADVAGPADMYRAGIAEMDEVAARVRACPDVVRLVGRPTAGATLRDGMAPRDGAAAGARPEGITVRVVCRFGPTVAELAAQVRAAVALAAPGCPRIDVIIDDLEVDVPAWVGVT
ncbi:hypothetical protein AB1484_02370 [Parafrankia sp. FMc6]|uniref:hypothetical protein n=1 Tax=Parafrankia soli TaxID=2599596 RepID=UPI0034D6295E